MSAFFQQYWPWLVAITVPMLVAATLLWHVMHWRLLAAKLQAKADSAQQQVEAWRQRADEREQALEAARQRDQQARQALAVNQTRLQAAHEQLSDLQADQADQLAQFKQVANAILVERGAELSKSQREGLELAIKPLHKQLELFRTLVNQQQREDAEARGKLHTRLDQLEQLNRSLGEDAERLTQALVSQAKTRGNWGEMVLERVFEAAGLSAPRDYQLQRSFNDANRRLQPDAIVHLPDDRQLVVDAKVALTNYYEAQGASGAEHEQAMKAHVSALRSHVKSLADKNYAALGAIDSPGVTFMFVPIESALLEALATDERLLDDALKRNIAIVTPTTLLACMATVASLWQVNQRNKNAQAIADRAGLLYDKFKGFVDDLEGVRFRLRQATESVDQAFGKLSTGPGNLAGQAEKLKKLGATTTKSLPRALTDHSDESE